MSTRFEGKTAIITGGSRGIGLGIANRLVADGAKVVLTARTQETLDQAVAELGGPYNAIAVAGKADDVDHQAEAVARAVETFGSADFLVNNTAISPAGGPLVEFDLDAGRKMVDVNCMAALSWVQQVYRSWMGEHGGAVVNVSSVAAIRQAPGIGFYGATKAMLAYLTQQLAVEIAPTVRVNAVVPALVKTKFATALWEGREDTATQPYPMKRLGTPEDMGNAAAYLLSDEASWVTGQLLVVDGGITLTGGS